ncbi:MAG: phosphoenolpyruvate carboxylase [Weeksellaceae bacterium]
MRNIPATMVTQHPDHASVPYWHHEAFISVQQETEECFRAFSELGATEYKWDWEGKFVDESVLERLLSEHYEYFQKNPLGKEKFLTFRLPNPLVETEFRLGRAFINIIAAAGLAKYVKLHTPPMFEVILPMTDSSKTMLSIVEAFHEITSLKHPLLKHDINTIEHIELIPLFEDIDTIMDSDKILTEYVEGYAKLFKKKPTYMRPYVARSDPALNAGIVPTVLAIKLALSKYAQWSKKTGIPTYPVIGCAALPFRGGLSPETVDEFVAEYKGIRTTTIQSAFRHDYPLPLVKKAIKQLEEELPKRKAVHIDASEETQLRKIASAFAKHYTDSIETIAPIVNDVAKHIPKRRERVQHVGLFGYSRGVGKVKLPRAIGFTAAMYSIGIPPELIGTGRGLRELMAQGDDASLKLVEKYFVNLKANLKQAGAYLNKANLSILAKKSEAWKLILDDVHAIEIYLGHELKPMTPEQDEHQIYSTKILKAVKSDKSATKLIEKAAILRRSLG